MTYDRKESLNIFYANRKTVPLTERIVAPPQHGNGTSQLTNGTSLWTNGTSERGNGTNYTLTSIIISDSTNGMSVIAIMIISLNYMYAIVRYMCVAPPVSDTDAGASPLLNPASKCVSHAYVYTPCISIECMKLKSLFIFSSVFPTCFSFLPQISPCISLSSNHHLAAQCNDNGHFFAWNLTPPDYSLRGWAHIIYDYLLFFSICCTNHAMYYIIDSFCTNILSAAGGGRYSTV